MITLPAGFKYKAAFLAGRPRHRDVAAAGEETAAVAGGRVVQDLGIGDTNGTCVHINTAAFGARRVVVDACSSILYHELAFVDVSASTVDGRVVPHVCTTFDGSDIGIVGYVNIETTTIVLGRIMIDNRIAVYRNDTSVNAKTTAIGLG